MFYRHAGVFESLNDVTRKRNEGDQGTVVKTVAVIEDDADIRRLLELRLRRAGLRVVTAEDGESGLRLVRAERPTVVLLDSKMPGMDGFAVCQAIRADSDLRGTYVILASGTGIPEEFQRRREVFPDVFMAKPYDLEELMRKIQSAVS